MTIAARREGGEGCRVIISDERNAFLIGAEDDWISGYGILF
jgi:hypothetical protein